MTSWDEEKKTVTTNDNIKPYSYQACSLSAKTQSVQSMREQMEAMSEAFTFSQSESSSSSLNIPIISWFVSYKETKSKHSTQHRQTEYEKQKNFFSNMKGEIVITKDECIVTKKCRLTPLAGQYLQTGF